MCRETLNPLQLFPEAVWKTVIQWQRGQFSQLRSPCGPLLDHPLVYAYVAFGALGALRMSLRNSSDGWGGGRGAEGRGRGQRGERGLMSQLLPSFCPA